MHNPINPFKQALHEKHLQIGLWLGAGKAHTHQNFSGPGF